MIKFPNMIKLLVVLAMVCSLVAIAAVPASAQTLSLSDDSGPVGQAITITANGFAQGQILTVKFDGVTLATSPASLSVPAGGTIVFSAAIPTTTAGAHTIAVYRDGINPITASFNVEPKVTITSPASKQGSVGTSVSVSGTGFSGAGVTVDVTMTQNGNTVIIAAGVVVDSTGSFTATGAVPTLTAGDAKVSATDGAGNSAYKTTVPTWDNRDTFKVTPTLTLTPSSGLAGSKTNITGSGWPDGAVNVAFAGQFWVTVNASGGVITDGAQKTTPAAASAGVKAVVATSGSFTASTTFTVSPRTLTLTPSSGPMGTQVLITGSNMSPTGTIAIGALKFANAGWNTAVINIDSIGTLSPTVLRVPAGATEGANAIVATDSGSLVAQGSFAVTAPTIAVSPTSGAKGSSVTFTGSGWLPGNTVTITFGAVSVTTVPDGSGNIAAVMTVPTGAAVGSNTINAEDVTYGNAAVVKFTVPAAAITVSPNEGPAGTSVTITGSGFNGYFPISIKIGDYKFAQQPLTDALGAFSTTVTVPGLAPGTSSIQVSDKDFQAGDNRVTAFFTIKSAPPTVASALANISSKLVRVWGYDAGTWKMYDPADAAGSNLTALTAGKGYWINVSEAATLIYGGYSYALSTGWNLIGWR